MSFALGFHQNSQKFLPRWKVSLLELVRGCQADCALCSNALVQAIALALSFCFRTWTAASVQYPFNHY
ncbi:MAG: hypothetical protein VKL59_26930 [Nostocaceae cyanobacterium]|nr:hypothetical protein [Nostocaceae cyanobacterium]